MPLSSLRSRAARGPGRSPGWAARLTALVHRRRAMAGSLLTLGFKAGGTVLMMAIFLMAARSMTPHAFGQLAVSFNALSFLAVLAVLGQDVLVIRSWGEYAHTGAHGLALGAYRFSWAIVAAAALGFAALTVLVGTLNPVHRFTLPEACAGAAFLAMQVLLLFVSQTTRAILNFVVSETNRELTWRFVLFPVVLAGLWTGLTPTVFYAAAALGLALAVGVQLWFLRRRFPAAVRGARPEMRRREWLSRARGMWLSAVLEAAAQYAEVLLLGLLVSPAVAGLYFVAARVANVFAMLGGGLHSYTVTHSANLFYGGERPALQRLFRSVMIVALSLMAPILLFVVVGGPFILSIFGPQYGQGYGVLILLSAGSFTAAMAGPSNGMLLISGHERIYSRVLLCALVVRIGLMAWAAPRFGAVGVAAAWALVNGPVAVGLAVATRKLTGIDPSVLSILGRRPAAPDVSTSALVSKGPRPFAGFRAEP